MAALATSLVESTADAQSARNSVFPDNATSPVVGLMLMSFSMALDHFIRLTGNPVRLVSPTLVAFADALGPLTSESVAALAEGDFMFIEGSVHPTHREVDALLEFLRRELELGQDTMTQWRLSLDREDGVRADRLLFSCIMTIEEMRYYEYFRSANLIQTAFKSYQWHFQAALVAGNQSRLQLDTWSGQQSQ